jgi:hypothetical protein
MFSVWRDFGMSVLKTLIWPPTVELISCVLDVEDRRQKTEDIQVHEICEDTESIEYRVW